MSSSRKVSKKKEVVNDSKPATQHDLALLGGELVRRLDEVDRSSRERDEAIKQEIFDHFDMVVDKLIMSKKEDIEELQETSRNHEQRITHLERR